ncbi:hypothetical protein D7S86_11605 [Pararobbsia silviterrae]|uniref:Uncharacterized protein n=1 Tax=Pararobbsia silviterrae TaxID=1792498 RepID=A0A494Y0S8_9BURK|nr:hypothetical protein D7S86_11605 [Pararobbsia silviterrae]
MHDFSCAVERRRGTFCLRIRERRPSGFASVFKQGPPNRMHDDRIARIKKTQDKLIQAGMS